MSDLAHSPRRKELKLLNAIQREADRATKMIMVTESGGPKGYEAYFGENGSLKRKWRTHPDPLTGVNEVREYTLVRIWEEDGKILHGRTEDGKVYQDFLRLLIRYYGPYKEVSKGKLVREKNVEVRRTVPFRKDHSKADATSSTLVV